MISQNISNLTKALCALQKELGHAFKDKKNPFYKSTYADLKSYIDISKIPLSNNGLAISQVFTPENTLKTYLLHVSGEYIVSEIKLLLTKEDPQGQGSAATYARRYSLAAILNMADTDDDANYTVVNNTVIEKPKKQDVNNHAQNIKINLDQVAEVLKIGAAKNIFKETIEAGCLKDYKTSLSNLSLEQYNELKTRLSKA